MQKQNKVGGITLSDVMSYYLAIVIKTVWCWREKRNTDQWNRELRMDQYKYTNEVLTKVENQLDRGKQAFSTDCAETMEYP